MTVPARVRPLLLALICALVTLAPVPARTIGAFCDKHPNHPRCVPMPTATVGITPTPATGYTVPMTIDSTGTADVTAPLNQWIESVPDGSTLLFRGGTYRLSQGLQLAQRHSLILDGQGATLRTTGSGSDQLASTIILGHRYGGFWEGGNDLITVHDFSLVGNDPTPGTFTSGMEHQAGVEIDGSTRIDLYNLTFAAFYGDAVKTGGSGTVTFHDSHVITAGRNCLTVISGSNVTAERNACDTIGYVTVDVEPNTSAESATNITFRNNTAGTWGIGLAFADGAAGSVVSGVTIDGNHVTGDSIRTVIDLARRQNVTITNNRSDVTASGPVLELAHIDGLIVTGNVQPLSSGQLASITDCTNVTYVP